ncbi:MAG: hypothetical protein LBU04_07125 [Christensenellaceae bacterium]|jgi:carbonic anhydrase/acetyltransferase-like protein (isoleucine patch superfamily)|nr:hypothetical protein [Christensenellaceae bacterium]
MDDKKYDLTNEALWHRGRTLHRIRALKDFGYVKKGDLGGWIEIEENLSHVGKSWIANEAKVYDDAKVSGNAQVIGKACVFNDAKVYENALVGGNAHVYCIATIYGNAKVFESAIVFGNARVKYHVVISGKANISSQEDLDKYLEAQKNNSKNTSM